MVFILPIGPMALVFLSHHVALFVSPIFFLFIDEIGFLQQRINGCF